ncbi:MAG: DUF4249 domain-containing protein [Reichenbachiella sp.]
MRSTLVFSVLIMLLLTNCDDVTWENLHIDEAKNLDDISVYGFVTNISGYHFVDITEPGQTKDRVEKVAVTNARVQVTDGTQTINYLPLQDHPLRDSLLNHYERFPYRYYSTIPFQGQIGNVYEILIEVDGKSFVAKDSLTASWAFGMEELGFPRTDNSGTTVNGLPEINYLKHEFGFSKPWGFSFQTNSARNFAKSSLGNHYYMDMDIYGHNGAPIQAIHSDWSEANSPYYAGADSAYVWTYSISEKYYSYLRALFNNTDWKEGIYSTYPGNPPTNFSEGATGFFHATEIKDSGITIEDFYELLSSR